MTTHTRDAALADALDRLGGYRFVDGPGLACHGTMGAEALSSLGFDELVPGWVETYKASHAPIEAATPSRPVDLGNEHVWQDALGEVARMPEWEHAFEAELRAEPWQEVVGRWVPRLLDGYAGGLTHGLLRTAHAVRMLPSASDPTPAQLGELARGLASWAGWYRPLPGPTRVDGRLPLDEAIASLPRPQVRWTPMEAGTFSRLHELPAHQAAVAALEPPTGHASALSDLTAAMCRSILAARDAEPVGLVHALTPITASRTLLPHVPELTVEAMFTAAWRTGAALLVGFSSGIDDTSPAEEAPAPAAPEELAARAAEHGDVHLVKFTEACLREFALSPDPVYLRAAEHIQRATAGAS